MGILALREHVDALMVVPNEKLKYLSDTKITLLNAFEVADDVLRHGVQSISDLINVDGLINLDFADVTSIMKDAGQAHMGVGRASGKDKAADAASAAISSPLLETSINGAKGVIINITGSPDMGLDEASVASQLITDQTDPDATIIWGVAFDESLEDEIQVTVIATGLDADKKLKKLTPEEIAAEEARIAAEQKAKEEAERAEAEAKAKAEAEAKAKAEEAERNAPVDPVTDGVISDSDFDDIMKILKRTRRS